MFKTIGMASGLGLALGLGLEVSLLSRGHTLAHPSTLLVMQESSLSSPSTATKADSTVASSWTTAPATTIAMEAERFSLSSSGERLLTSPFAGNEFQVWNTQTGELLTEVSSDRTTRFDALAISNDGTQVAAVVQTAQTQLLELWLWNIDTGEPLWKTPLGTLQGQFRDEAGFVFGMSPHLAFRPGDDLIVSQIYFGFDAADRPSDLQLSLHDVTSGEVAQTLETPSNDLYYDFEFSPDGTLLAGVVLGIFGLEPGKNNSVQVWQLSDGELIHTLDSDGDDALSNAFGFVDMVFTGEESLTVLAQHLYDIRLNTWNPQTGERVAHTTDLPSIDRQDRAGQLSPDGRYYYVRSDYTGTRVINLRDREVTALEGLHHRAVFSNSGNTLAIATPETIQIFFKADPKE
ncbi:hypothetical protein PN498_01040 [Oscillatoria sp. CS-180]|uniref:WD40 repeat domain-containing protein n=1 Tax=Oscillatoria sp. CS-180 TaxID=3021720 RepID=UPI00232C3533|nr:hypothetical protein [Oscillatoria sp. CS-180]MDB9524558.1 hypothetical protein [Oscillatoria sp. CS-180]